MLVVVFGAPVRHEDHEERAIRCCVELLRLPGQALADRATWEGTRGTALGSPLPPVR